MQPRDLHVGQLRRARCSKLAMIALLLLAGLLLLDRSYVFSPRPPPDDNDEDDDDDDSLREPPPSGPGVALARVQPAPIMAGALLGEPPTTEPTEPAAPARQPLRLQPLRPPARVSSSSTAAGSASKCGVAQPPALRPLFDGPPTRCAAAGGNAGADDAHRCACGRSGLVVVRAEATGRYLTAFWGGGEVFAIGALDRMPLRRMTFRMEPAAGGGDGGGGGGGGGGGDGPSPWVTLRHLESGGELVMLPKGASQGGFMLLARQGQAPASGASQLFCAEVPQQGQGQG